MEFEDMKKIWDTQNQAPLYAINQAALNKRIQAKSKRASKTTNVNDIGLIIIMIAISIIIPILSGSSLYTYTTTMMAVGLAIYIGYGRYRRKQKEKQFERTLLGELEVAIENTKHEINRAKTFVWWMIVPFSIPVILNMVQKGVGTWKWLLVIAAFILSYVVTQWGLKKYHLPRKKELETLKDLLENG